MIKELIWNNKTSQKQQHPDLIQAGPQFKGEKINFLILSLFTLAVNQGFKYV